MGEGTHGTIELYQCKQISNKGFCDKLFVVKRIKYETDFLGLKIKPKEKEIDRFYKEYEIGMMLHHPNIRRTLDIDVKFLRPCAPGPLKTIATITKEGKSICFTDAVLYQNDVLIATSSATNKLVNNPF